MHDFSRSRYVLEPRQEKKERFPTSDAPETGAFDGTCHGIWVYVSHSEHFGNRNFKMCEHFIGRIIYQVQPI